MTASTIVLILVKVTVAIAIGLAAVRAARRRRASVRHALLAATLVVALVVPVAAIVSPPISIAVPIAATPPAASPGDSVRVHDDSLSGNALSDRATPTAPAQIIQTPDLSPSLLFVAIWIVGAILALTPLVAGLWQMRILRRSGTTWRQGRSIVDASASDAGIRRRVDVLLHQAAPGPLTFGTLRPAILLPPDAATWSDDDLRRAVVHELEHVRRADWVTQCIGRVVCAAYWFHPLMWIVWRRFVVEAERACDDAVLGASDATDYADQLVALAARLSSGVRQPRLAMANRADLSTRVGAVLDARQERGRAGAARIALVAAMASALVIVIAPLRVVAQTPQAGAAQGKKLRYDAATIKPCEVEEVPTGARGTMGGTNATFSPGRFSVPCVTTEQLIYLAYAAGGVKPEDRLANDDSGAASNTTKVRGGPDWVHSLKNKYAIEATAVGATERTVLVGDMLQSLLEDRFQLRLHRDTEEVSMYELVVAKGGLKLKPMQDGDCEPNPGDGSRVDPNAAKPRCGNLNMMSANGLTRWTFGGSTLGGLAGSLGRLLGVYVIDRTNVTDKFIMRLEFQRDDVTNTAEVSRRDGLQQPPAQSLTASLAGFGLELRKTKGPRGFLVIDHIERPKPDGPLVWVQVPVPARAKGPGTPR